MQGSIVARVFINQSVRACDLGKLLILGVSGIGGNGIDPIIPLELVIAMRAGKALRQYLLVLHCIRAEPKDGE